MFAASLITLSQERPMPEAETGQALQVLDLLLDYFGDDGERWTRDHYDDGDGRRCLVGALVICAANTASQARARSVFCTKQ